MQINAQTLQDLFSTFSARFKDGLQRGRVPSGLSGDLITALLRFSDCAMTFPSGGESEVHAWLNQIPGYREWIGDRIVTQMQTDGVRVINRRFHETCSVPRTKIEDDQVGVYGALIEAMGSENNDDAFPLDLCLDALRFPEVWSDGAAFYSTTRTLGANTICNDMGNVDLTAANLKAAAAYMMGYLGENNLPFNVIPAFVLCGQTAFFKANRLYKNQLIATGGVTESNDVTSLVQPKWHPRLEANEWYLMGIRGTLIRPLAYQLRRGAGALQQLINPSDPNVFFKDEFIYGCDCRAAAFCPFPFAVVRGYGAAGSATLLPGAAAPAKKEKAEKK